MDFETARQRLEEFGQGHLLNCWEWLSDEERGELLQQIDSLDLHRFTRQRKMLPPDREAPPSFKPFTDYELSEQAQEDCIRGEMAVQIGAVGCLIVAGGQGSRLGWEDPKGTFPISVIRHKSLFQLMAEKVIAAGDRAGRDLFVAIMTSQENHAETVHFFEAHDRFGLKQNQLFFFCQSSYPLLDEEGDLFLESPFRIAFGASGNGEALHHFYHSGLWEKWYEAGVRFLTFLPIDNPLADPMDVQLIGFQIRRECQVAIKCAERLDVTESVGVVVDVKGRPQVIEYSEMPRTEAEQIDAEGYPSYRCANLSLFSFAMDFIEKVVQEGPALPMHLAHKSARYLDAEGEVRKSTSPIAWKFEYFIFDLMPLADSVAALLCPREECYAALKRRSGLSGVESVQQALQNRDRQVIERLSGVKPPDRPFELDQRFYYPDDILRKAWQGRPLPESSYIVPFAG